MSSRVAYDEIARDYDTQPYRARPANPDLLGMIARPELADGPAMLDLGCGTGNQLVASRAAVPRGRFFGLDRSIGMLRRAQGKAAGIGWIQGEASALPFASRSFDVVSSQFAFHHVADKPGMLREAARVLRPGGRFALHNLCPHRSGDWLYYAYFPEAQVLDLLDFWPPEAIIAVMEGAGFASVSADYQHLHFAQDLEAWLELVRSRRDACSQLQAIPDSAYEAGLGRLARDVADARVPRQRADHLCMVTFRGEAPAR